MSTLRNHDTALAPTSGPALAGVTPAQFELVRRTVAPGATDDELILFLHACRRMDLDPMVPGQVHFSKPGGRVAIMVGIDGMRAKAQATGELAAIGAPQWCGPDGAWRDVWLDEEPPAAARVWVRRTTRTDPDWGVALYRSFRGSSPSWRSMPEHMLAKVATAAALRSAFPEVLGGVSSPDELPATVPPAYDGPALDAAAEAAHPLDRMAASLEAAAPPDDDPGVVDLDALMAAAQRAGHTRREVIEAVRDIVGDLKRADWSEGQWQAVTRTLRDLSAQEVDHA